MALFFSFRVQFCKHHAADYYSNKVRNLWCCSVYWSLQIWCHFHTNSSQLARVGFYVVKLSGWHCITDTLSGNWVLQFAVYMQEVLELELWFVLQSVHCVKKIQSNYCTSCTLKKAIMGASFLSRGAVCHDHFTVKCEFGKTCWRNCPMWFTWHIQVEILLSACVLMNTVGLFT